MSLSASRIRNQTASHQLRVKARRPRCHHRHLNPSQCPSRRRPVCQVLAANSQVDPKAILASQRVTPSETQTHTRSSSSSRSPRRPPAAVRWALGAKHIRGARFSTPSHSGSASMSTSRSQSFSETVSDHAVPRARRRVFRAHHRQPHHRPQAPVRVVLQDTEYQW